MNNFCKKFKVKIKYFNVVASSINTLQVKLKYFETQIKDLKYFYVVAISINILKVKCQ